MLYDTEVSILGYTRTPDGMGGFTKTEYVVDTFKAKVAPMRINRDKDRYGVRSNNVRRIVTQATLPDDTLYLQIGDTKYMIDTYLNYNKHKIITAYEILNAEV